MEDEKDIKEFKRLRNYYRRNFTNGGSDESFILWCEGMCEKLKHYKKVDSAIPSETDRFHGAGTGAGPYK